MQVEVPTSDTEEQESIDAETAEYWTSDVEEQQRYLDALNADNWLRAINHVGRRTSQLRNAHARALSQQAASPPPVSQQPPDESDAISQRQSTPPLEFPSSPLHDHPPTTPSSNADPFALPLSAAPSYVSPHPQSNSSQLWSRHSSLSPLSHRSISPEPQLQLSLDIPSSSPAAQPRLPTPSLAAPSPPPPAPDPPPIPDEPTGRYGLRQRKAAQITPYTHDRLLYKTTLRHNPDAIVHRAELREKTPEESQDAGQGESQQDVDMEEDEDMQDAFPSPRKRRRSVTDDLPGDDDRPRHRAGGGSSYKRTKSFRKHPQRFPLPAPSRHGSSSRPRTTGQSPTVSSPPPPRATQDAKWEPAAYKSDSSDDDLQPIDLSTPPRKYSDIPSPRYESPAPVMFDGENNDEGHEDDNDDEAGFDARSDDVISLTDASSPVLHSDRSLSEDIEVRAPRRLRQTRLYNSRPLPRAKPTKLAPIFTKPGRQSSGSSGVTIKLKHASRPLRPKAPPRTKRKQTGPQASVHRRQVQLRTTHEDRHEHRVARRARNVHGPAPIQVEVFAAQARLAREKRPYATVDLEDDGIRRALAPLQLPTVNRTAPVAAVSKPPSRAMMRTSSTRSFARTSSIRTFSRTSSVATSINLDHREADAPGQHHAGVLAHTARATVLRAEEIRPPRLAYQLHDTFLERGRLRETLGLLDGTILRPHREEVLTRRLSPFSSATDVGDAVQSLCVASNIPWDQLEVAAHNAVMHIAWSCNPARPDVVPEADVKELWEIVFNNSDNMVTRAIDSSEFGSSPAARDVLYAHWISLELTVAFTPARQLRDVRLPAVSKRMRALITRLVAAGIDDALRALTPEQVDPPNDLTTLLLSLWIRAIYVCSKCSLSLSTFVGDAIAQTSGTSPSLKRSELIWTLVYGIEALSRFNPSGVYTTTSIIEPLWSLVALALDSIRLKWIPDADDGLAEEVLLKRDDHLRLIVRRCWILYKSHQWALEIEGLHVVEQLASIFRSRKFANLMHESCALPTFVLDSDTAALFRSDDNETAFVTWLKLFAVAVCDSKPEALGPVRKLLAVLPVGSISIQDLATPTDKEFSMVCNRLALGAALLAMHVRGTNPAPRRSLSSTHQFLDFAACGESLRAAAIDAVTSMGSFEQRLEGGSWADLSSWGATVIRVLRQDWERSHNTTELSGCSSSERLLSRLLSRIEMLLRSARERGSGLSSFLKRSESERDSPGRCLLEALNLPTELLCVRMVGDAIRKIIKVCIAFCIEQLPILPHVVQKEESQDEYADMIFDVPPDALAAIDALNDHSSKEDAGAAIRLIVTDIVPELHRIICEFSLEPGGIPMPEQSAWLAMWLDSVTASVKYHTRDWGIYMGSTTGSPSRIADEVWRVYVEVQLQKHVNSLV